MLRFDLDERMLMSETGVTTVVQDLTECVDKVAIRSETDNIELARRLDVAKSKLITALAKFPVAVFWIFKKYEQNSDYLTLDFIDTSKKYDLIASLTSKNDTAEKQGIIERFTLFTFSFDDLVEMTDLVIYYFQTSEAGDRITQRQHNKLTKRLSRLKLLNKSELFARFKVFSIPEQESLSSDLLYQQVLDVVGAEHIWMETRLKLVENNTKLVLYIASQYKSGFLDFDDLVQEGQTGLLAAVDKFDYRLGCQFSTYAAYWIRQRISRALSRNARVVRIPCEQVGNIGKLFRAKEELLAKTGQEPTSEQLANHLTMTLEQVNAILAISQTSLSLENFDSDEEEAVAPIDLIEQQVFQPALNEMAQSELESWLKRAIKTLNPREFKVICCHFGIDKNCEMTLQEIGAELNISRERVRQIQVMAFNKMKLNYGEQLVSFL